MIVSCLRAEWLATAFVVLCLSLLIHGTETRAEERNETIEGQWRAYGADSSNSKYSPLDQIHAGNVKDLQVTWRWSSPDNEVAKIHPDLLTWAYEATPLMVDGVLYTTTSYGMAAAIDATSGESLWIHDPLSYLSGTPANLIFIYPSRSRILARRARRARAVRYTRRVADCPRRANRKTGAELRR